ncbi:MAG: copper oxidase, partial [Mesorhizobium sp.]
MKRRDILKGAVAGAAAFAIPSSLLAAAPASQSGGQPLGISRRTIEVSGKAASVF